MPGRPENRFPSQTWDRFHSVWGAWFVLRKPGGDGEWGSFPAARGGSRPSRRHAGFRVRGTSTPIDRAFSPHRPARRSIQVLREGGADPLRGVTLHPVHPQQALRAPRSTNPLPLLGCQGAIGPPDFLGVGLLAPGPEGPLGPVRPSHLGEPADIKGHPNGSGLCARAGCGVVPSLARRHPGASRHPGCPPDQGKVQGRRDQRMSSR